jgi:hypothetical protein
MNSWGSMARFLRTDPADAGCAETFELLDRYVERQLAHGDAARRYPEIAAHLSGCNPCVQDFDGLLAAIGGSAGSAAPENSSEKELGGR